MTMEQNNMEEVKSGGKSSIDFGALWQSVIKRKKTYYKVLGITFFLYLRILPAESLQVRGNAGA